MPPMLTDAQEREMERTWITEFPFLKGDLMLSQIYELHLGLRTEVLAETKMEVSKASAARENDETN
jgi:hypothetical protein